MKVLHALVADDALQHLAEVADETGVAKRRLIALALLALKPEDVRQSQITELQETDR